MFTIGDSVIVQRSKYKARSESIPDHLIIHGWAQEGEQNGKIVAKHDKYWIVKFDEPRPEQFGYLEEHMTLLKTNSKTNMSLITTFKNLTRTEPNKSFVEAGVMDDKDVLTAEGKELFIEWLFAANAAAFNDEVVQPILKDQEEK